MFGIVAMPLLLRRQPILFPAPVLALLAHERFQFALVTVLCAPPHHDPLPVIGQPLIAGRPQLSGRLRLLRLALASFACVLLALLLARLQHIGQQVRGFQLPRSGLHAIDHSLGGRNAFGSALFVAGHHCVATPLALQLDGLVVRLFGRQLLVALRESRVRPVARHGG